MSKMKYSGVEWIGDIPIEWNYSKFKYIYNVKKAKLPDELETENNGELLPYLSMEYIRDNSLKPYYCRKGTFCNKNDLLLLWDGSNAGEIIYNHPTGFASSTCAILSLKKSINELYSNYYMKFLELKLRENTNGMGIPHVDAKYLNNLLYLVPNINEQKLIANFLEEKTTNLDNILLDLNKQLEILSNYKSSVIIETITKGLNKNVELKYSGINWVGEIPIHWNLRKIKHTFIDDKFGIKVGPFGSSLTNCVTNSELGKYKIYGQANLIRKCFEFGDNFVNEKDYLRLKNYEVKPGDIAVSMMGTIGKCCVIPNNIQKGIMDSHLIKIRLNTNIMLPKYFEYQYEGNNIFEQLLYYSNGSIMNGLNSTIVKNIYFVYPPLEEQKEIVDYLDKKCSQIDKIIEEKQKQIKKIEEYKKSVIYEYVTGKKRVEGAEELYG